MSRDLCLHPIPEPTESFVRELQALPALAQVRHLVTLLQDPRWRVGAGVVTLFAAIRQSGDAAAARTGVDLLPLLPPAQVVPLLPCLRRYAEQRHGAGNAETARRNSALAVLGWLDAQGALSLTSRPLVRGTLTGALRAQDSQDGVARAAGAMMDARDAEAQTWGQRLMERVDLTLCSREVLSTAVLVRPALYQDDAFRSRVVDLLETRTALATIPIPYLRDPEVARLLLLVADVEPEGFVTLLRQVGRQGRRPLAPDDMTALAAHRDARVRLAVITSLEAASSRREGALHGR